jgi:hypothetical protein
MIHKGQNEIVDKVITYL